MWLNHCKYNGFGECSLLQKSKILGDFGIDFGVVLGALGITFGPVGIVWWSIGRSKVDSENKNKKNTQLIPAGLGDGVGRP